MKWLGVFAVVVAGACSDTPKTDCNDGLDNDGDGLIDEADPGCPLNMGQLESPDPTQCNDGLDNDGDGLIDLLDYGCADSEGDDETDPVRACNDGMDNDGDMNTDFPNDSGCESPVDNDEFNPAACQDFADNDGDGFMDWPFDPGCDAPEDDDETDPSTPPACSDGVDNDGDMFTDYPIDPGCSSAADADEFNTVVGACGPSLVITDITATGEAMGEINAALPNELTSDVCHGYGGEFAYTYAVAAGPKALVISTDHAETTLDTVVYIRTECRRSDTELGCDDDSGVTGAAGRSSELVIESVDTGTYYIIVDSFGPGSLGTFKLTVEERTALGGTCDPSDPNSCIPGLICREFTPGAGFTCEFHVCGDGVDNDGDGTIDFPVEPGCTSILDDDETNPVPPPQCGNGLDDDGDGLSDYPADPGCDFAADTIELDECYPGKSVNFLDPVLGVTGTTSGDTMIINGSCGGIDGPEDVYAITPLVALTSMTIDTQNPTTTFDTVLYVREEVCDSSAAEVACNDNISGSVTQSSVTFTPTTGNTYFVIVDGGWMASGTYHIDVSGIIAGGGVCDPAIPNFTCASGFACRESTPGAIDWLCRVAACSDTLDNDGDSFTDFPNDPGCNTPSDDAEDFPNPVTACSDGLDNDGDGFIDYSGGDIGCGSAADNGEIDECVPGATVTDHPGGTMSGNNTTGTNLLAAPVTCDGSGTSGTSQEVVYVFNNTQTLTNLRFSTAGSGFDTILYIRYNDCGTEGPLGYCNDNVGGTTSEVNIASPPIGNYFAIVDAVWSGVGPFNIIITGTVAGGGACTAGDPNFVCATGYACTAGVCTPADCNDGTDNDGDGDIDYPFDPGCTSISDGTEADSCPGLGCPQCGDGVDNDGDGFTDYPLDDSCASASDDNEACASFGTDSFGYQGCQDTLGVTPICDDIVATGTLGCTSDDCNIAVALPFTFDYYGTSQTSVGVGSNGKLGFPGSGIYSNTCTIEANNIAVYWDDLYPPGAGATGTYYQTLGTAPNRRFVVNWRIPHISGGTNYDIRAVIWETTNDIDLCYIDTVTGGSGTDLGASATVGIQDSTSLIGIQYSCNTATVTEDLHLHFDHP